MSNETLILIMYLIISILSGVCMGLLDSRNYWRRKWEQDEDYIIQNIIGKKHDK